MKRETRNTTPPTAAWDFMAALVADPEFKRAVRALIKEARREVACVDKRMSLDGLSDAELERRLIRAYRRGGAKSDVKKNLRNRAGGTLDTVAAGPTEAS